VIQSYTYSKTTKEALPWTPELQQLKKIMRTKPEKLITLASSIYTGGWKEWDGIAMEKRIKKNGAIASVSLEQKENAFKHKTQRSDFTSFSAW
jgi:uncharacterized membrane protein